MCPHHTVCWCRVLDIENESEGMLSLYLPTLHILTSGLSLSPARAPETWSAQLRPHLNHHLTRRDSVEFTAPAPPAKSTAGGRGRVKTAHQGPRGPGLHATRWYIQRLIDERGLTDSKLFCTTIVFEYRSAGEVLLCPLFSGKGVPVARYWGRESANGREARGSPRVSQTVGIELRELLVEIFFVVFLIQSMHLDVAGCQDETDHQRLLRFCRSILSFYSLMRLGSLSKHLFFSSPW